MVRGLKRTLHRAARNVRHPRRAIERQRIRAEVAAFLGGDAVLRGYEREHSQTITERSITFCSSRTLPGHE